MFDMPMRAAQMRDIIGEKKKFVRCFVDTPVKITVTDSVPVGFQGSCSTAEGLVGPKSFFLRRES